MIYQHDVQGAARRTMSWWTGVRASQDRLMHHASQWPPLDAGSVPSRASKPLGSASQSLTREDGA